MRNILKIGGGVKQLKSCKKNDNFLIWAAPKKA